MGLIMKKMGLVLALLSAFSMTVLPVAPSYAAAAAPERTARQAIVDHAARGEVVILSQAQMNDLAATKPALHAKLSAAYQNGTVPKLTASERRFVQTMTAGNLELFKAGLTGVETWIVVILVVALVWLLWRPVICTIFPGAWHCAPYGVGARG